MVVTATVSNSPATWTLGGGTVQPIINGSCTFTDLTATVIGDIGDFQCGHPVHDYRIHEYGQSDHHHQCLFIQFRHRCAAQPVHSG